MRTQTRTRTLRLKTLWVVVFLLAGAAAVGVDYPDPVCAVRGSTVTLPCTFTPVDSTTRGGPPIKIIRVRWCRNHLICHLHTPSVVDSREGTRQEPRHRYLGDLQRNCTLQISDVQKKDEGTLRFRMEASDASGHFTGQSGVNVTVVETMKLQISGNNTAWTQGQTAWTQGQTAWTRGQTAWTRGQTAWTRGQTAWTRGQTLSLLCTASCTFHHLEITWLKDGHALSESGPALQLGPLTGEDSGNYTCGLKTLSGSTSPPFRLQVEDPAGEAGPDHGPDVSLVLGLVFGVLLIFVFIFITCIIKRRRAAADEDDDEGPAAVGGVLNHQSSNSLYSNMALDREHQEIGRDMEDISYAVIHFQHENQAKRVETAEDAVVYSSIVNRS